MIETAKERDERRLKIIRHPTFDKWPGKDNSFVLAIGHCIPEAALLEALSDLDASDKEAGMVLVPEMAWEGLVGWARCGHSLSIEVQNAVVAASEEQS